MDRRGFLKTAGLCVVGLGYAGDLLAAEKYFPVKVDKGLFKNINRQKNPNVLEGLEKLHVPQIKAPDKVKAGEKFAVEVTVGKELHPMGPEHWIEYVQLNIGNEPAGRTEFQSAGYMKPKVTFWIAVPKSAAPKGKVTLVVYLRCNLHGYWEGDKDITVET